MSGSSSRPTPAGIFANKFDQWLEEHPEFWNPDDREDGGGPARRDDDGRQMRKSPEVRRQMLEVLLDDPDLPPEIARYYAIFNEQGRRALARDYWFREWASTTSEARDVFLSHPEMSLEWLTAGAELMRLLALGADALVRCGGSFDDATAWDDLPFLNRKTVRSVDGLIARGLFQYLLKQQGANLIRGQVLPTDFRKWTGRQLELLATRMGYNPATICEAKRRRLTKKRLRETFLEDGIVDEEEVDAFVEKFEADSKGAGHLLYRPVQVSVGLHCSAFVSDIHEILSVLTQNPSGRPFVYNFV